MAVMRLSSGVSVAVALWVFLLPFGRPGRRFATAGFCFLASALALLAAFSASLRTTCSMRIGNDAPLLDAHQGESEESQPWHRLAVQAREETIEAMGAACRLW